MPKYAATYRPEFDALDLDDLDDVVGGTQTLQAPAGGSIRETTSGYKWWGMNYQQTTRDALDANGNVVGSEVVRPGSVWSDDTVTTDHGSSTTYSTGGSFGDADAGGGAHGSFSTNYGADGQFTGVEGHADAEAHANGTAFGDLSAGGSADGHFDASPDGLTGHVDAHGQAQVVDPDSGYGVGVSGDAHADGHVGNDGVSWDTGAGANGYLSHDGEQLGSLQLAQVGTGGHVGYDQNGDLSASLSGHAGALGERGTWDAGGTYHQDGTVDVNGSVAGHFGTDGPNGAGGDVSFGGHGTYHPDGSFDGGVNTSVNGHITAGDWNASAGGQADATGHFGADGSYHGTDVTGSVNGSVAVPGDNHVSGTLEGHTSYDENGNVTSSGYSAEGDAHVLGQDGHWSSDDQGAQQGGAADHQDDGGSAAADAGSHDYDSASADYGSHDDASAGSDYSGGSDYSSGSSGSDYSGGGGDYGGGSGDSGGDADYA